MATNIYKTWVEISEKATKHNLKVFRKLVGSKVKIMAVVKSNAYGHGILEYSKLAHDFIDWFGVDSLSEALKLRKEGIKKPILVLGYTLNNRFLEAIQNNVSLTLYNFESLKSLAKFSKKFPSKSLKIHLKIETGMHRQGIHLKDLPKFLNQIKKNPIIKLEGIYTHFASAKDITYPFYTYGQLKEFKKAVQIVENSGFKSCLKHAAATGATFLYPESHLDMVRIGIGLYGLWPSKEVKIQHQEIVGYKISLKPVLAWKSIIAQIKSVKKGSFIGYDLTETMTQDAKIAVVPIGYWHGYDRGFSSVGEVLIRGKRCKVLGRVSMDMIVVEVTHVKSVKIEDEVVILGQQGKEEITADELAQKLGTISYEIVTRINSRIPRIVV